MGHTAVIALARPNFDIAYAQVVADKAFAVLDDVVGEYLGPRELLYDAESIAAAIAHFETPGIDMLVVLQVTFTDATLTRAITNACSAPLLYWAFPEDRTGGRLRLNALCGMNLAAYTMRRDGHPFSYMYRNADDPDATHELRRLIAADHPDPPTDSARPTETSLPAAATQAAADVARKLRGFTTGVIGSHPDGFDPCAYDPDEVQALTGVVVQRIELEELFAAAEAAVPESVESVRARAAESLGSLDALDQSSLERSLRLYCGMRELATANTWSAFATRCWPECFEEFGGAACSPQAMMTNDGVPGGCEADVYGNLTSLILRELAGEPPFVADLVGVDARTDTAVFWHCGLAPMHMADPAAVASPTIHPNRHKPLLNSFPLKPGRATIARLSQSGGTHRLVIGTGEMLHAPPPFSGTSGVFRFDRPAADVLATIMEEGLEHHYGIVYGGFEEELHALAAYWKIPVVNLT